MSLWFVVLFANLVTLAVAFVAGGWLCRRRSGALDAARWPLRRRRSKER